MLRLPKELELQLKHDITLIGEEKMKYVTSWERYAREEGEARTLLKLLKLKFNNVPAWVEEKVNSANMAQLDQWVEKFLTAESVDSLFEDTI
jgi:hypothetical protein